MKPLGLATFVTVLLLVLAGCSATTVSTPASSPLPPGMTSVPSTTLTANGPGSVNVIINTIFYEGDPKKNEANEFVEIQSLENAPVEMQGWVLKNANRPEVTFTFPEYVLQPGSSVRVYTNEVHPVYGGFTFHSDQPLWGGSDNVTAILYDSGGDELTQRTF